MMEEIDHQKSINQINHKKEWLFFKSHLKFHLSQKTTMRKSI